MTAFARAVWVITRKDLIVRLQAPRFFVEKDEVVLSANVHNYLKTKKKVQVALDLPGKELTGATTGNLCWWRNSSRATNSQLAWSATIRRR